jgi:hypothetical protein
VPSAMLLSRVYGENHRECARETGSMCRPSITGTGAPVARRSRGSWDSDQSGAPGRCSRCVAVKGNFSFGTKRDYWRKRDPDPDTGSNPVAAGNDLEIGASE